MATKKRRKKKLHHRVIAKIKKHKHVLIPIVTWIIPSPIK